MIWIEVVGICYLQRNLHWLSNPTLPPGIVLPCQQVFLGTRRGCLITSQEVYPSTSLSCCVSSVPRAVPGTHWTPFILADICLLLSYIRRCTVKNPPLRNFQKSCFLYCKALFSGYIFHKHNLSLITAWPWGDLKSQNLIIHIGPQGYPVERGTENCSQPYWWMAMQPLSVFLQWQGTKWFPRQQIPLLAYP